MTDEDVNEQKLAYHHPENPQYSLVHVTDDQDRHAQLVRDLEEEDELDTRTERDCVGDTNAALLEKQPQFLNQLSDRSMRYGPSRPP
jgi:hypothetical protein